MTHYTALCSRYRDGTRIDFKRLSWPAAVENRYLIREHAYRRRDDIAQGFPAAGRFMAGACITHAPWDRESRKIERPVSLDISVFGGLFSWVSICCLDPACFPCAFSLFVKTVDQKRRHTADFNL